MSEQTPRIQMYRMEPVTALPGELPPGRYVFADSDRVIMHVELERPTDSRELADELGEGVGERREARAHLGLV